MWIVHRDLAAAWLEPVTLVDLTERGMPFKLRETESCLFLLGPTCWRVLGHEKMPMVLGQCDQMDKSKQWTWKFWMLLADATNPTRLPRMPLMEPNVSLIFGASQPHIFGPGGSIVVVLPVVPRLWRGPRTAGLAEDHEWHAGGVWSKKNVETWLWRMNWMKFSGYF